MGLADHSRQLVAYNEWANNRLLDAVAQLAERRDSPVADAYAHVTLGHLLMTQRYWYANWTGASFEEQLPARLADLQSAFDASHAELRAYFDDLTDEGWHRTEQWWRRWGYEHTLPVGETLFQVINHSTQHRSEVALFISERGVSPGELDYLMFKQGS
jgi:uncharacterized damage-inducible protein DinB